MKFKTKYLTIIGMILIIVSCEDFLDHDVTTGLTDDNIGEVIAKSPGTVATFLESAYRQYAGDGLYARNLGYALYGMGHDYDLDYTAYGPWNELALNSISVTNGYFNGYVTNFYKAVNFCNSVISLVDKADRSLMSESGKSLLDNYKGEALFIRAITNFDLLRIYGEKGPRFGGVYPANKDAKGIPLQLELATAENAYIPRSTVQECYASIIADLETAYDLIGDNLIPANTTVRTPGSLDQDYTKDYGWAQKPAVAALLGKVYLYMNDYTNAKTKFEEVIADSRFALDRPVNFTDYIQHTDNNPESIFSLQFYYDPERQARGRNHPIHQLALIHTNVQGAWLNTFLDPHTFARFDCGTPDQDPRIYEASLYDHTWSSWSTETTGPVWTTVDVNDPTFRCYVRKFIDFYKWNGPHLNSINLPLIRLADIYLMYAEVQLGLGNVASATEYVNKVRRRAWDEADYDAPGTKGEDFATVDLATLQEERFKELMWEGHRWFDVCRWGILDQELAIYPSNRAGIVQYDDIDYYAPIPESQINVNPQLVQSDGY